MQTKRLLATYNTTKRFGIVLNGCFPIIIHVSLHSLASTTTVSFRSVTDELEHIVCYKSKRIVQPGGYPPRFSFERPHQTGQQTIDPAHMQKNYVNLAPKIPNFLRQS